MKHEKVLKKVELKDGPKHISIEPLEKDLIIDFEIVYVRETGGYVKVQWLGESYPNGYNYGYPERDLELVSAA